MISLEFEYRTKTYYALIRNKWVDHQKHYYVTIMNGELESLLFGNHIISASELNNHPFTQDNSINPELRELRKCIKDSLHRFLKGKRSAGKNNSEEPVYG